MDLPGNGDDKGKKAVNFKIVIWNHPIWVKESRGKKEDSFGTLGITSKV